MKKLFLLLLLFPFYSLAQVAEPTMVSLQGIGGNVSDNLERYITSTSDSDFIIMLSSNSAIGSGNIDFGCTYDGERMIFVRYDADATHVKWSKCFGFEGDSAFIYVNPISGENIILGGLFNTDVGWGILITKQDAAGAILWQKNYSKGNGPRLMSMIATDDGGYIMMSDAYQIDTNMVTHFGSNMKQDIWLLKVDSNGSKVWSKIIGGSDYDFPVTLVKAPGDGVYLVGSTYSTDYDCVGNHGELDIYLSRLDKNGNAMWKKLIGGSDDDYATSAFTNSEGGLIIAATCRSSNGDRTDFHTSNCPVWALEVDSNRNILWNKCYGDNAFCYARSICKATNGDVWITGETSSKGGELDTNYGTYDAWIIHTDETGNFLHAKVLGSSKTDRASMIYPLRNGNVISGGFYSINNNSFADQPTGGKNGYLAILSPFEQTMATSPYLPNYLKTSIFPNPAHDILNIDLDEKCELEIFDVTGRSKYIVSGSSKVQINVMDWSKGLYYARVSKPNGFSSVQKLLIN